jgi:hypothetical protein
MPLLLLVEKRTPLETPLFYGDGSITGISFTLGTSWPASILNVLCELMNWQEAKVHQINFSPREGIHKCDVRCSCCEMLLMKWTSRIMHFIHVPKVFHVRQCESHAIICHGHALRHEGYPCRAEEGSTLLFSIVALLWGKFVEWKWTCDTACNRLPAGCLKIKWLDIFEIILMVRG